MVEAVIFDLDGVLLQPPDRSGAIRDAIEAAFSAYGMEPTESDVESFYSGEGSTIERVGRVCDRHDLELAAFWTELERQMTDRQRRMITHAERELYDDCSVLSTLADTVDLGIVSNNTHATIEFFVEYFGLEAHFETWYGRDPSIEGYQRRKPDPHYVERALDDLETRTALYVGDRTTDVIAAHRAGLDPVFVRRTHASDTDLTADPTYEIDRLTDLPDLL